MRALAAYENTAFGEPIEYALGEILSLLGVAYDVATYSELRQVEAASSDMLLTYGKEPPDVHVEPPHVHVFEGGLFGKGYLQPTSLPIEPLSVFRGTPVAYWGTRCPERESTADGVERVRGQALVAADVVASSFFFLSRYEEAVLPCRPGRTWDFPAQDSIAGRWGFLHRPVVNEYVETLRALFVELGAPLVRPSWWEGADFAVCLTHDVDRLKKFGFLPPLRTVGHVLRQPYSRKVARSFKLLGDYLSCTLGRRGDPYLEGLNRMVSLEAAHGAVATHFFLADGSAYSVDAPQVVRIMKDLKEAGCEVALHGGLGTASEIGELREQARTLSTAIQSPVRGNRQHYLEFDTEKTWAAIEDAGLAYDSTLGYNELEGFRCGICHPFRPFDLFRDRPADLWEIPLQAMEASLLVHQGLPVEAAQAGIIGIADAVERHGGIFVPLWHNSSLYEAETPGAEAAYRALLEYLSTKNCAYLTLSQVLGLYTAHSEGT